MWDIPPFSLNSNPPHSAHKIVHHCLQYLGFLLYKHFHNLSLLGVLKMTYSSIILFEIFCLIVLTYSKISRDFNGDNVNQTIHEGCGECAYYRYKNKINKYKLKKKYQIIFLNLTFFRCPESSTKCLLGSVPDPCECCPAGRCAKFGGEPCWNSSIIKLSKNNKKLGFCATNYACQLRNDLLDEVK